MAISTMFEVREFDAVYQGKHVNYVGYWQCFGSYQYLFKLSSRYVDNVVLLLQILIFTQYQLYNSASRYYGTPVVIINN